MSRPRKHIIPKDIGLGIIEGGVPQAYIRARPSSATLCSVHVLRVFLCTLYTSKKGKSDTYQNGLGYISAPYPNPYAPVTVPPPYDYSNWAQQYIWHSERRSQERRTFLQNPPSKTPLFLVRIWSFPSVSSLGDYSMWRSSKPLLALRSSHLEHFGVHCLQIRLPSFSKSLHA